MRKIVILLSFVFMTSIPFVTGAETNCTDNKALENVGYCRPSPGGNLCDTVQGSCNCTCDGIDL